MYVFTSDNIYLLIHEEHLATASSQILSQVNLTRISATKINFQIKLKVINALKIHTGDDYLSICPDCPISHPKKNILLFKKKKEKIVSQLRAVKILCH